MFVERQIEPHKFEEAMKSKTTQEWIQDLNKMNKKIKTDQVKASATHLQSNFVRDAMRSERRIWKQKRNETR